MDAPLVNEGGHSMSIPGMGRSCGIRVILLRRLSKMSRTSDSAVVGVVSRA